MGAKLRFFAAHDDGIEQCKVSAQNSRGYPRMRCNARPYGEDGAAKIERIARVRVGACDGQNFLFVQMARSACANEQTEQAKRRSPENAARSRAREPQDENRKRIA